MGEISDLILSGVLDCETGEYIGAACGYPRTIKNLKNGSEKCIPKSLINKYGYDYDDWSRMKECTKIIIRHLYSKGYKTILDRQAVLDEFARRNHMFKRGTNKLVRNSNKYTLIYGKYREFKLFVESYKLKENGKL